MNVLQPIVDEITGYFDSFDIQVEQKHIITTLQELNSVLQKDSLEDLRLYTWDNRDNVVLMYLITQYAYKGVSLTVQNFNSLIENLTVPTDYDN